MGLNPDKRFYVYDKESFTPEFLQHQIFQYDYVLLPHYVLEELHQVPSLGLLLNMMSYQEMPHSIIDSYLKLGYEKLTGFLYSNNMDRHPFNGDISVNVTQLLTQYFHLFPTANTYLDPTLNSDHPWFYRFFAGTSKKNPPDFHPESTIKVRAFVSDKDLEKSGHHRQDWRHIFYQKET